MKNDSNTMIYCKAKKKHIKCLQANALLLCRISRLMERHFIEILLASQRKRNLQIQCVVCYAKRIDGEGLKKEQNIIVRDTMLAYTFAAFKYII